MLEQPAAADPKRKGCLIWGAVLGIVVGGMFAAYGLKPILRHYYGERHIAAGETYQGGGKELRVLSARADANIVEVTLAITLTKTWAPEAENFQLEVRQQDDWIEPSASQPTRPVNALANLPVGERVEVVFRFEAPVNPNPVALHLGEPRLKMDLPPAAP